MPTKWEIWMAEVKFEDDLTKSKQRPVLVIDNTTCVIISLKITSKPPRSNYYGEYPIIKWKEAGLIKQSTVRISKRLPLVQSDFVFRIGKLKAVDIINVQKYLT